MSTWESGHDMRWYRFFAYDCVKEGLDRTDQMIGKIARSHSQKN